MEIQVKELIERGRRSYERADYVAALADFRDVLARHPEFADIRHLAGLCLGFLGQHEAALEEFDRAIALNDQYVEAHLNRALVLNELGRFEDARAAVERAGYYEYATAGRRKRRRSTVVRSNCDPSSTTSATSWRSRCCSWASWTPPWRS